MGRDGHFLVWLFGPAPDACIWDNEAYAMMLDKANELSFLHTSHQAQRCNARNPCRVEGCMGEMGLLRESVQYLRNR